MLPRVAGMIYPPSRKTSSVLRHAQDDERSRTISFMLLIER